MEKVKTMLEYDTVHPKTGEGVADGDGGSLEREEIREDRKNVPEELPLEDEGDWANNPHELEKEDKNSVEDNHNNDTKNESIEGAMNNPGITDFIDWKKRKLSDGLLGWYY